MEKTVLKNREHFFWMDLVRVIASWGVVVIHVAADVITEWGAVPAGWWWVTHVYDSLVRGCVPAFMMISGALLLPGKESLGNFFKKRIHRVLIPFLVWTCLYLIWKKAFFLPDLNAVEAIRLAAGNRVHFHLWFLYSLTGLYLAAPVFRVFVQQASRNHLLYFLILCFVMASLQPFAESILNKFWHLEFHSKIQVEAAQGFVGYFILGYFIRQYAGEGWKVPAVIAWFSSLMFCIFGMFFLCSYFGRYEGLLYESLSPNVVIYSASFIILMKVSAPVLESACASRFKSLISVLSSASLGIYLIHPMVLDALIHGRWGVVLSAKTGHPFWSIPATSFVVFLLSFAAVWILQKIPYVKRIV